MKRILIFCFLFLLVATFSHAQNRHEKMKAQATKEAQTLRQRLIQEKGYTYPEDTLSVNYKVDMFIVEKTLENHIDADLSTANSINAVYAYEKDLDSLLNKYYRLLYKRLKPEDKQTLKNAQRNWIKFRDSERALVATMSHERYTGGGTIQGQIKAMNFAQITKRRVEQLYGHLSRITF
ncbi:hypothetical protein FUAX_22530 [Fulvitalea axinellae]|uniref:Lysozyme inhibitor LprI-like N-terminal domain-containing protein n=1 Tax=Fulvitalea axinellae TaxID=1182444 RepID=A0AAU9DA76_9BACT|nr:hypothetical protein FUAX_22530 [Fulvitalea axinellae]